MKKANLLFSGVLLSFLCFSTLGCSDSLLSPPPKTVEVQPIEKVKTLTRNSVKIEYVPTLNPNSYNAVIKWPLFDGEIKIKNSDQKYLNDEIIFEDHYIVPNLQGGSEKSFFIEMYNKDRGQKSEVELKLLPPKDLVISNIFGISKDTILTYNRIFLLTGSRVFSNEFQLVLNFNELIIEPNVILSHFNIGQKSTFDREARNGGLISLNGQKITGHLKIIINAEVGGDAPTAYPRCMTFTDNVEEECFSKDGKNSGTRGRVAINLNQNGLNAVDYDYEFANINGGFFGLHSNTRSSTEKRNFCGSHRYVTPVTNPVYLPSDCKHSSNNGQPSTGGSFCIKLNKDSNYDCVEKN